MPRAFYKEKKIIGKTIETPVINLLNLDRLFRNRSELEKLGKLSNPNFISFTMIFADTFYMNGKCYFPKQMLFWDNTESDPSEFYFIAIIDDEIEIKGIKNAKNIEWYDMSEAYFEVDGEQIKKIETTIETLLKNMPQPQKIAGIEIDIKYVENLLETLTLDKGFSKDIVEMAYSPTDYFEKNEKKLREYEILEPSKNMYLIYLVLLLEENEIMRTVDWKEEYSEVLYALNELSGLEFESIDESKHERSTAGKILSSLNEQVENKTNKTIFCIDTNSDSYSFGLIEKDKFKELKKAGKKLKIEVYQPKK
ncbi:MAG: hypothetical protein LBU73_05385 [Helicobacteraceae bacterium]|nr:hypothetical protein [Helicobacteraceae bacterium]